MLRSPEDLQTRIVIPAYNEAGRIVPTIRDYCETFGTAATVVVVANGCTDDTVKVARSLQRQYSNLTVIEIPAKIGKGGAVRVGLSTGEEPLIGFVDADGSTAAADFAALVTICRASECDGVIGSRWLPGSNVLSAQPWQRRVASRAFNALVRLAFRLPYSDTQCGAKVFKRGPIDQILHSLEVANFAFDIEVLWRLKRAGMRVLEIPTTWCDRQCGTKVRLLQSSVTMSMALLRMRLRDTALWWIPFIDRFARTSVIPVRSFPRLLIVGAEELPEKSKRSLQSFCSALNAIAVETVESSSFFRYAFYDSRQYDAVIQVGKRGGLIGRMTTKPVGILRFGVPPPGTSKLEALSRGRAAYWLADGDEDLVAASLLAFALGTTLYPAMFWHGKDARTIRYKDDRAGRWEATLLK